MTTQLAFAYHRPSPTRRRVCDLPLEERPLYRLHRHGSDALARGEQSFSHREYKGTRPKTRPEQGRRNGQPAVSRVLSIAVKGENVYVELKSGPGKLTPTGAITPNGPEKWQSTSPSSCTKHGGWERPFATRNATPKSGSSTPQAELKYPAWDTVI